jgi:hypothetical protein
MEPMAEAVAQAAFSTVDTSRGECWYAVLYDDRCLFDPPTRPMDLTTAMAWRTAETLCSLGRGVLTAVVGRQIR